MVSVDILKTVEVRGIAPRRSWVIILNSHYATPTADSEYQDELFL